MIKRIFDLLFSIIALIIFSPFFIIIAIIIKLHDLGPVFYMAPRVGQYGKLFNMFKFRTMVMNADKIGASSTTLSDSRITTIGHFLRKYKLDELPQLINVFIGNMSIVGPRPHPGPLNMQSKDKVKMYMLRHLVKPGITGWAQVNGHRGETASIEKMQKRIEHDIWYIENWSFWLDIQIIFMTVWNMIKGDPNAY